MTCDRVQIINKGQLVFSDSIESLNKSMLATSLIAQFENSPTIEALQSIDQVNSVDELGDNRFRLKYDTSPAKQIAIEAVNNNWGLLELSPEQKTLEQIFVEITSTEFNSDSSSSQTEEDAA